MPRPRNPNPQPKKYIVKQKLKNGGYHVLERTTVFDPDRRQMKVLSSRLIGKLEPGQTDLSQMVETDKFYSRNKKKAATDTLNASKASPKPRKILFRNNSLQSIFHSVYMIIASWPRVTPMPDRHESRNYGSPGFLQHVDGPAFGAPTPSGEI